METTEKQPHWTNGLKAMNANRPLANSTPLEVLTRYESGESIQAIANDFGIAKGAVYRYLIRNAEDEWKEYQFAQSLVEYGDARQALKDADDGVTVSRARELARLAWQEMQALNARLYGSKQQIEHTGIVQIVPIDLGALLASAVANTPMLQCDSAAGQIDGESERVTD